MNRQEVIKAVLENNPREGWFIYRYHFKWGILGLVFRLLYLTLFGWMTWMFWRANPREMGFVTLFGLLTAIGIILVFDQVVSLGFARKNMIVLTEKTLVKSWRGKIDEYDYSQIKEAKMTRIFGGLNGALLFPEQYVTFEDATSGQTIELARNRRFGLASNIYSVLQSKLIR